MPDLVYTYGRLQDALKTALNVAGNKFSFYSNNVTPNKSSTFGAFTIAVDPITFVALTQALTAGSWVYTTDANGEVATYPQIGMVVNGTLDLYGYLVYDSANLLIYAQRFDVAPYSLVSGLNPIVIQPIVHCDSP